MKNYYSPQILVGNVYVNNPDYIPGCESTLLIQRLKLPRPNNNGRFGFGCGLPRGGLSLEAWELISPLCSFDYMGAAEFEFGALANAFAKLWDAKRQLEAWQMVVYSGPEFNNTGKMHMYNQKALEKIRRTYSIGASVFVLSPRNIHPLVADCIFSIAVGDDGFLKEPTCLRNTMFTSPSWVRGEEDEWVKNMARGWIELDNGFMFFADEEMWRGFANIFGVVAPKASEMFPVIADFSAVSTALETCPKARRK